MTIFEGNDRRKNKRRENHRRKGNLESIKIGGDVDKGREVIVHHGNTPKERGRLHLALGSPAQGQETAVHGVLQQDRDV